MCVYLLTDPRAAFSCWCCANRRCSSLSGNRSFLWRCSSAQLPPHIHHVFPILYRPASLTVLYMCVCKLLKNCILLLWKQLLLWCPPSVCSCQGEGCSLLYRLWCYFYTMASLHTLCADSWYSLDLTHTHKHTLDAGLEWALKSPDASKWSFKMISLKHTCVTR